ncbi:MAG TPA: polyprenyl diphosphate synthase [Patescibacteria group bacterium]
MTIKHLAIIMDGNRRWAKARGWPSLRGHQQGYDKVKRVGDWCLERGIKILTLYAFSTENWKRTEKEVKYLMGLLERALTVELNYFQDRDICLRVIGRKDELSSKFQSIIQKAEEATKDNQAGILNLAINYGGRPEIIDAVKNIVRDKIKSEDINQELFSKYVYTAGLPDPDLIIRTSGEQRLSGFLTWQSVYSEFYFIDKHWPDFSEKDLDEAIDWFDKRERRFGGN